MKAQWRGPAIAAVVAALLSTGLDTSLRWQPSRSAKELPPPSLQLDTSALIAAEVAIPDTASVSGDAAAPYRNPFTPYRPAAPPGPSLPRAAAPALPPPARPWRVTGLVGTRAAVLAGGDGTSRVVSPGERVDSARVVSIDRDGVVLEDRGGKFRIAAP